jgi:hypothetical protein
VGDASILGKGASPVLSTALNQGAKGALMGAGANSESPLLGAAAGGTIGFIGGAVAGKLSRTDQIISDKVDDATRIGYSPFSIAGQKSIKAALDNDGQELTTEEIQKQTYSTMINKLQSVVPNVNINKDPMDMITDLAKANKPAVQAEKDALYAPLNDSLAVGTTTNTSEALSLFNTKTGQAALPEALPKNPTLSDMMTYRRQVSASLDSELAAIRGRTMLANPKLFQQLKTLKTAVTQDISDTATPIGLGDQLAKADSFYNTQYRPFNVYKTDSGQLLSDTDSKQAWGTAARLLKGARVNTHTLSDMADMATTLGPEGKQIFGAGFIKQAINRSMLIDDRLNPVKVTAEFNRLQNLGLMNKILTPELQDAFQGIKNISQIDDTSMRAIAEGALKTVKGIGGQAPGWIGKAVNAATHNAVGMQLLRIAGAQGTPLTTVKNVIAKLLLNASEKGAGTFTQVLNQQH